MSEWTPERLKELADAEEAAYGLSGILACSPEIWREMNTVWIVMGGMWEVDSIWWSESEAHERLSEMGFGKVVFSCFSPPKPKFSEIVSKENRIFSANSEKIEND